MLGYGSSDWFGVVVADLSVVLMRILTAQASPLISRGSQRRLFAAGTRFTRLLAVREQHVRPPTASSPRSVRHALEK